MILDWWTWLLPIRTPGTGALPDNRPEARKEKDFSIVETVARVNPVRWVTKSQSEWRSFPPQDQDGSGSCVAQSLKKMLGILHWLRYGVFIKFSATHIYQRRGNRPSGGMNGVEAFDIAMEGVTLDILAPSDRMTDRQMDLMVIEEYKRDVGEVFGITGHIGLPAGDIDVVASTIQTTHKGIMVWFYFTYDEWAKFVPTADIALTGERDPRALRHSVVAVDATLYEGKKALIVEDSAYFGGFNRRVITQDFFNKRNFFARYPMNFRFDEGAAPPIPSGQFSVSLRFIPLDASGVISNLARHNAQKRDVATLQEFLKQEGLFPTNVDATGYYGSITAKAVLAFQKRYRVASDEELDSLMGRVVGPKTIQKLNELISS